MEAVIKRNNKEASVSTYSPRTIVIGDVHGAFKALKDLIEKVKPREDDTLIFLGDFIDGFPESPEVVNYVIQLAFNYNVICIKGNHDEFANQFFQKGVIHPDWRRNGGTTTIKRFKEVINQDPNLFDMYHDFFRKLNLYYIDDQNNLFVHGGFEPTRTLTDNKSYFGEQIFYWDRELIKYARNKHVSEKNVVEFIPSQEMFKEIFVGHTTTEMYDKKSYKPLNFLNLWMLDTGGGWTGKLTAMDVNSKEIWQSDFTKNYYPNWKHD